MKKIYLEFFRGISSLFILGWHIIFLAPTGHFTRFSGYWGTDALMMFYMLSGLVINLTQSNRPITAGAFLRNRFIRIYPQFVAGMLLAFAALYITSTSFPTAKVILGNFFMVSTMKDYMGYIVPSIQSNLPVWSLSFEMAFYVLFAISIGHNQKKIIFCWFMVSLIALPCYYLETERNAVAHIISVLAFSSIWLIGYYIYQFRNYFYADKYVALFALGIMPLISRMHFIANFYDPLKYFILSLFAIPFFRYCLQLPPRGKKIKILYLIVPHSLLAILALSIHYMPLKNAAIYCTLPYVYISFAWLTDVLQANHMVTGFVSKAGAILGKYSYSLYITHFTVLFVFSRITTNMLIYLLAPLPVIVVIAYGLENWLQPAVNRYFKKRKKEYAPVSTFDLNLKAGHA